MKIRVIFFLLILYLFSSFKAFANLEEEIRDYLRVELRRLQNFGIDQKTAKKTLATKLKANQGWLTRFLDGSSCKTIINNFQEEYYNAYQELPSVRQENPQFVTSFQALAHTQEASGIVFSSAIASQASFVAANHNNAPFSSQNHILLSPVTSVAFYQNPENQSGEEILEKGIRMRNAALTVLVKEETNRFSYVPSKIRTRILSESIASTSYIQVPARGYADDKDAKGIFYDWFVFRRATTHEVRIVVDDVQKEPFSSLKSYLKVNPYADQLNTNWNTTKLFLKDVLVDTEAGLLVIPGRMRDREYDSGRTTQENFLIRQALKRGQPILAICAGAWRLWEAVHQLELDPTYKKYIPESLISVEGHVYSRMMSFSEATGKIVYNIGMHEVEIQWDSLLDNALNGKAQKSPVRWKVNSVHWKAVDPGKTPALLKVSADSVISETGIVVPRLGMVFPQGNVVEAFESKAGSPLMGIQWHPEAYNPGQIGSEQLNILRYMAKAGDTYRLKRQVVAELKGKGWN